MSVRPGDARGAGLAGEGSTLAATAGVLVVLQGYLPLYGQINVTLWQLFLLLVVPVGLAYGYPPGRAVLRPASLGLLMLLTGSLALVPTSRGGGAAARSAVFLALTLTAFLLGYAVGAAGRGPRLLKTFAMASLPFAVLNVAFYLVPSAEIWFLQSPFAPLLIEPDTLRTLFEPRLGNNVLAPLKAGTLFVNTNVASIFFGLGLGVSLWRLVRRPRPGRAAALAVFLFAFLATGSRAGIAALLASGLIVAIVLVWRAGAVRVGRFVLAGGLLLAGALALPMSRGVLLRIAAVTTTGDPRLLIWAHAIELLASHPIAGVGFHGWEVTFPAYARTVGLDPTLPPHSAYLIAWLWLGLEGLLAMIVLFGGSIAVFIRETARRATLDIALLGLTLTVWFGVQLLFTNFAVLEPRVGGAFLLLLGTVEGMAHYRRIQSEKARGRVSEHVSEALRGMAVPPDRRTREI